MKRKIVEIDENLCNGCGLCVNACHEGAIQLVDGKAKLVSDIYCDGLGDCLGDCPVNAIKIIEREADAFDESAVKEKQNKHKNAAHSHECGCPGMKVMSFQRNECQQQQNNTSAVPSELSQWPLQLHLVPVNAPYWNGSSLLVAADCTAFAYGNFHSRFLKGKKLIIACPKLDVTDNYVDKLAAILDANDIKNVTVLHMEVPCCKGLVSIVNDAVAKSSKNFDVNLIELSLDGHIN